MNSHHDRELKDWRAKNLEGMSGANQVNYFASKAHVKELANRKKKLKNEVEVAFIGKQIPKQECLIAHKKFDAIKLTEFQKHVDGRDILPLNIGNDEAERVPFSVNN